MTVATGLALVAMTGSAIAGKGSLGHDHGHNAGSGNMDHSAMAGGAPGATSDVTRKILILAKDTEFNLKSVQVKAGETVKFIVRNKGEMLHEFTIGPSEMQKMHQAKMQTMMDKGLLEADRMVEQGSHSHPNSVILEPGETKEIIWKFAKAQSMEFGCNIPGHYESGMKGKFVVGGSG